MNNLRTRQRQPRLMLALTPEQVEALARLLDHGGGMGIGPHPTKRDLRVLVEVASKLADLQAPGGGL